MSIKRGTLALSFRAMFIIILSIVIIILTLTIFLILQSQTQTAFTQAEEKIDTEIELLLLPQNEKVAVPLKIAEIKPNEEQDFFIGILNTAALSENYFLKVSPPQKFVNNIKQEDTLFFTNGGQILYFDEKIAFSSGAWRKEKIKIIPPKDASGSYQFQVKVLNESGGLYGREQILRLIIKETSSNVEIETLNNKETKEQILPENETVQITKWVQKNTPAQKNKETTDCLNDFSCDDYFVYLPLGEWSSQALFEARARERAAFFEGISDFKFKKVGNIFLPLNFVKDTCKINSFGAQSARDHLLAKRCADRFVDKLGISYEKVIALSSSMAGGYAFIKGKSVYTTLGYIGSSGEESPSIVAHELGHAYSLCDEYDFKIYEIQNRLFGGKKCRNKFPNQCSTNTETCLGNTPTYRDYEGQTVQNVCLGQQHYSVMGYNQGYECGYDATGGYEAVKN